MPDSHATIKPVATLETVVVTVKSLADSVGKLADRMDRSDERQVQVQGQLAAIKASKGGVPLTLILAFLGSIIAVVTPAGALLGTYFALQLEPVRAAVADLKEVDRDGAGERGRFREALTDKFDRRDDRIDRRFNEQGDFLRDEVRDVQMLVAQSDENLQRQIDRIAARDSPTVTALSRIADILLRGPAR